MYGNIVFGVGNLATVASSALRFKTDHSINVELDDDFYDDDIDLINDLDGGSFATSSNASASNAILLTDVQPGSYEWVVIDRLNVISISAILSTCLLFLVLVHRR